MLLECYFREKKVELFHQLFTEYSAQNWKKVLRTLYKKSEK